MISNFLLRQATEEYHEESMSAIPTENEIDHVFSDRFEKNMDSIIKKNKHPQLSAYSEWPHPSHLLSSWLVAL